MLAGTYFYNTMAKLHYCNELYAELPLKIPLKLLIPQCYSPAADYSQVETSSCPCFTEAPLAPIQRTETKGLEGLPSAA